jgi:hypothetical protein
MFSLSGEVSASLVCQTPFYAPEFVSLSVVPYAFEFLL